MSYKQTAGQKPRGYPNSWSVRKDEPVYTNRSSRCRSCRHEMVNLCCAGDGCPEWRMMIAAWRQAGRDAPYSTPRPCAYCSAAPCGKAIEKGWY